MKFPLDKLYITQKFGENPEYYQKYGMAGHNGWDFRTRYIDSPLGKRSLFAVEDMEIISTVWSQTGYGIHIKAKGAHGEYTYAHLDKISVAKNQKVKEGDVIGISDNTGDSSAPHLHFGWKPNNANPNNGFLGCEDPTKLFMTTYKILCINGNINLINQFKAKVFELTNGLLDLEITMLHKELPVISGNLTTDNAIKIIDEIGFLNQAKSIIIFYPSSNASHLVASYYPQKNLSFVTIPNNGDLPRLTHEFLHLIRKYINFNNIKPFIEDVEYYPANPTSGDPNDPGWRFQEQYEQIIPYIPQLQNIPTTNQDDMKMNETQLNNLWLAVFKRPIDEDAKNFYKGREFDVVIADILKSGEHAVYTPLFQAAKAIELFGKNNL